MEVENFAQQLNQKIKEKANDSPTHRKAIGILQSLMEASVQIPNFNNNIANNPKAVAFYITAGTYKLLKKTLEGDHKHEHQLDAYLLLLSMTLPDSSPEALTQGGLLKQLKKFTLIILKRKDITPLMTRLAISILSYSFSPEMTTINFHKGEDKQILLELFDRSVASPRSNALSRQCSRLLTHLLKNNPTVSTCLAESAKASLFSNLDDRKELYLSNIKEVMIELPVRLINDICYKVAVNLGETDSTDPSQQQYLAQTYYFLEKMTSKLLASTLQDMILILINSIPAGTMPEKVQLSYLQLLYECIIALVNISEQTCNRVLSPVISVLIEMLVINQKISKFACNQLSFIIQNCIRSSLWRQKQDELSLEAMQLEEQGKEFTKIVCLFQGLFSSRFPDTKLAATLVSMFFNQLSEDAFGESLSLIHKTVQYRDQLEEKKFKKVMESVFLAFGAENILRIYPISLNGDIGQQNFEGDNNLWMLSIIEKTERAERMTVFNQYLLPLLQQARIMSTNPSTSKQRKEAYKLIEELLWRCLRPFTKVIDPSVNYEQVFTLIEGELSQVSENTLNQLAIALNHLSEILLPQNYKSKGAELLIKALANIFDAHRSPSKQILQAIQGLSKISSQEYVKRVFDKNIQKLITLGQQAALSKQEDKNIKNLQILMAVNSAIDLRDPSVTTKYKISREELVLRLATCLISSTGVFQKKGYKYLSETLSASPKSLYLEILQLFERQFKVQNGSKFYRLSVIGKLWSWLKSGGLEQNLQAIITFMKNHLPQILLSLREQNSGAREQALRLILEFTDSMEDIGLLDNFVQTVCAGLVAERSEMKLATLSGLSAIIGKNYCSDDTFKEILEIVLLLLQQKKQELYKGVTEYCKKSILGLPVNSQKEYLPTVLKMLFEQDEEGKLENRSILRHFLIKLTKKHGKDALEEMIPQAHRKMLSHTLKMETREKKKKKELKIARMQQWQRQNEQKKGEASESEEEEEALQKQEGMDVEQPLEQLENTNNLLLKYDLDKEQFHFQQQQRGKPIVVKKNANAPADDITFDDKGIMIIEEHKRVRETHDEEHQQQAQKQIEQPLNFKKKTKAEIHQIKESGATYKTVRAGGDVKLKDKPEPYAFIQFNSKALNKRFKKQAQKVFDTLFQKKQGGLKGLKQRMAGKH